MKAKKKVRTYKTRVGYAPTLVRVCYKLTPEAIAIVKELASKHGISSGEVVDSLIKSWAEDREYPAKKEKDDV